MKHLKIFENSTNYNLEEFIKQKEKLYGLIEQFFLLDDDFKVEVINIESDVAYDGKRSLEIEIMEIDSDQSYTTIVDEDTYKSLLNFLENPEVYISAKKYNI